MSPGLAESSAAWRLGYFPGATISKLNEGMVRATSKVNGNKEAKESIEFGLPFMSFN
jgi:hypothetical protein